MPHRGFGVCFYPLSSLAACRFGWVSRWSKAHHQTHRPPALAAFPAYTPNGTIKTVPEKEQRWTAKNPSPHTRTQLPLSIVWPRPWRNIAMYSCCIRIADRERLLGLPTVLCRQPRSKTSKPVRKHILIGTNAVHVRIIYNLAPTTESERECENGQRRRRLVFSFVLLSETE